MYNVGSTEGLARVRLATHCSIGLESPPDETLTPSLAYTSIYVYSYAPVVQRIHGPPNKGSPLWCQQPTTIQNHRTKHSDDNISGPIMRRRCQYTWRKNKYTHNIYICEICKISWTNISTHKHEIKIDDCGNTGASLLSRITTRLYIYIYIYAMWSHGDSPSRLGPLLWRTIRLKEHESTHEDTNTHILPDGLKRFVHDIETILAHHTEKGVNIYIYVYVFGLQCCCCCCPPCKGIFRYKLE